MIPPVFAILSAAYIVLLLAGREIDKNDWLMLKSIFASQK